MKLSKEKKYEIFELIMIDRYDEAREELWKATAIPATELPPLSDMEIEKLYKKISKIEVIKMYRLRTNLPLRECKNAVDAAELAISRVNINNVSSE